MKDDRLSVDLAGLRLANPTMLASGILGYSAEMLKRIAEAGAGALVTKSIGTKPCKGYPNPTLVQTDCGIINAMGLPSPGIGEFAGEIMAAKSDLNVPLIVSVYGFSDEEYATAARKAVESGADAVELNVSCPHVKGTGSEIGQNTHLLRKVVRAAKKGSGKPVFVKLSPNVTSIVTVAEAAEKAGADGLTLINTVRAMMIDVETAQPILANRMGGLSGEAIRPIAVRAVYDVYENVKIPIVGCGGVANWRDAVEFLLAGASAVQMGTSVATRGLTVFSEVTKGMNAYLRKKKIERVSEIVGLSHRC